MVNISLGASACPPIPLPSSATGLIDKWQLKQKKAIIALHPHLGLNQLKMSLGRQPGEDSSQKKYQAFASVDGMSASNTPERAAIEAQLRQQMVDILHVQPDDIRGHRQFSALGLDSIAGVEWIERIHEDFGLAIEAETLYEYTTLDDLTGYISAVSISTNISTIDEQARSTTQVSPSASRGRHRTEWTSRAEPLQWLKYT